RAEAALMRQKDIYNALSQTNQAIMRCTSREELFHEICRIAVVHGRFLFAWIGLLSADGRRVEPVARHGEDAGYVEQVHVSAASADARGRGPTGEALADGRHAISNDFLNDPATAPWHEAARRAGVRSSGAFPIRLHGAVIGSINLYGSAPGFFTDDLLPTLDEMATDVSFALDNFTRTEALRTAAQVVEASPVVLFRCRPQPGWPLEYISANVITRWGYPSADLLSGEVPFSQLVYPEDLPRVSDEVERYTREGRTEFQQEYRIVTADGRVLWMEDRTHVVRDGERRVLRYEGVLTDITERKQAHQALKEMLTMLQALIQASPEAITIIEADGRIRAWNPGAERIFGWREEEVLGLPLPTILAGREEEYSAFRARVLGGDTVTDIEVVRQRKDGTRINISLSAAPLRTPWGAPGESWAS
ncbi:MAG: PAS domain S-box protein, partial [candidate division NC10 bacterium]